MWNHAPIPWTAGLVICVLGSCVDVDDDGWRRGVDCDDHDPDRGGPEVRLDHVDNDCDGAVDCDDPDLPHGAVWQGDLRVPDLSDDDLCLRVDCREVAQDLIGWSETRDLSCVSKVGGTANLWGEGRLDGLTEAGAVSVSGVDELDGLASLHTVHGELVIERNAQLASLAGLGRLRSVRSLRLYENDWLRDIDALLGLTEIPCALEISTMASLDDLSGLANVTALATDGEGCGLSVAWSHQLANLDGLSSLETLGGDRTLDWVGAMTSLEGLSGLDEIGGSVLVTDVDLLTTLRGLHHVEAIGGSLRIGKYRCIGTAPGQHCYWAGNTSLATISDLGALSQIGGDLVIGGNPSLASLDGLQGISVIPGNLVIADNGSLDDVSSLASVTWVDGDVTITDNPLLTDAAAQALVDAIGDIGGTVTISGNR